MIIELQQVQFWQSKLTMDIFMGSMILIKIKIDIQMKINSKLENK